MVHFFEDLNPSDGNVTQFVILCKRLQQVLTNEKREKPLFLDYNYKPSVTRGKVVPRCLAAVHLICLSFHNELN